MAAVAPPAFIRAYLPVLPATVSNSDASPEKADKTTDPLPLKKASIASASVLLTLLLTLIVAPASDALLYLVFPIPSA